MLSIDGFLISGRMAGFGKNLTELRKARNLTQIELVNLLDVQPRRLAVGNAARASRSSTTSSTWRMCSKSVLTDPAADRFEIRNRKLKELCKQVDQLKPDEQDVICHFLDMAVRHERLKELVGPLARRAG